MANYLDKDGVTELVKLIKENTEVTYAKKSTLDNYQVKGDYQPLITQTGSSANISQMKPNQLYIINGVSSSVTVSSLDTNINSDAYNEYMLQFIAGDDCTFQWPTTIKWANDLAPIFEANKTYNISILNDLGVWAQF